MDNNKIFIIAGNEMQMRYLLNQFYQGKTFAGKRIALRNFRTVLAGSI